MKLILPDALGTQILREAQIHFPRECCGLIEGVWCGADAHAIALHSIPNRAADADRFEMDPGAHLAAQKAARAKGYSLLGCYHSHPGGQAQPSQADAAGAGEENFLWLIAALVQRNAQLQLRAWRYDGSDFAEIGLVTGADLVTSSSNERI
jgi:desampylase